MGCVCMIVGPYVWGRPTPRLYICTTTLVDYIFVLLLLESIEQLFP
jgi:hypothetical protein